MKKTPNPILDSTRANLRENPFVPHPRLGTGHLQTIAGSQQRRLRELSRRLGHFLDLRKLRQVRTIREFDELVTAPLAGFDDALHYYREVSSVSLLSRVVVPVLLVHSKGDPLLPWEPFARPEIFYNRSLLVHLTESGGHAAFIARKQRRDVDRSWAENRVIDFFRIALSS